MASFVSTMHEWRRMCIAIQTENQKSSFGNLCSNCPIKQFFGNHKKTWDSTDDEFRIIDERVQAWADKNKEPVYPSWHDYLHSIGVFYKEPTDVGNVTRINWGYMMAPIPADIAKKMGLKPKEE